jgi:hypothetical protein
MMGARTRPGLNFSCYTQYQKGGSNAMVLRPVGEPNTTAIIMPMRDEAMDFDDGLPR